MRATHSGLSCATAMTATVVHTKHRQATCGTAGSKAKLLRTVPCSKLFPHRSGLQSNIPFCSSACRPPPLRIAPHQLGHQTPPVLERADFSSGMERERAFALVHQA